jgi:hypothetical protein
VESSALPDSRCPARLPRLIAEARINRDQAGPGSAALASTQLSQAYAVATALLVKLHDDVLAWSTADRGLQAAHASGDPVTVAEASRLTATVLRRTPHRDSAQQFILDAAGRLQRDTGLIDQRQSATYVGLLATAAYTAALHDQRDAAWALLAEADDATGPAGKTSAIAERDTPQEVRFRPWAQHLVGELLAGDTRALPGVREFAVRVGAQR